jgi:hypothetical protein
MSSYIYCFIRQDISPEQRIVQIGHACFEAGKRFSDPYHVSNLVLLSARDEADIKEIAGRLGERDINFYVFYEPDNGMGHSAICTRPITNNRERAVFKQWGLFKHAS